jgi:hypothetical protein
MINIMPPLLKDAPEPRIVNVASTTASLALTSDPTSLFGQENNSLASEVISCFLAALPPADLDMLAPKPE